MARTKVTESFLIAGLHFAKECVFFSGRAWVCSIYFPAVSNVVFCQTAQPAILCVTRRRRPRAFFMMTPYTNDNYCDPLPKCVMEENHDFQIKSSRSAVLTPRGAKNRRENFLGGWEEIMQHQGSLSLSRWTSRNDEYNSTGMNIQSTLLQLKNGWYRNLTETSL